VSPGSEKNKRKKILGKEGELRGFWRPTTGSRWPEKKGGYQPGGEIEWFGESKFFTGRQFRGGGGEKRLGSEKQK